MYNPLVPLTKDMLQAMLASGCRYFIRQSYPRGKDTADKGIKSAFLISHYRDWHKAYAHYKAIVMDGNKYMYDVKHDFEKEKLFNAAAQPPYYKIYANILPKVWVPGKLLRAQIEQYILNSLKWTPGKAEDIQFSLASEFGDLLLRLQFQDQGVEIPLKVVERYE